MNPADAAMNPNAITSGSARSPIQYVASGAATHAAIPGTTAGRYPFSVTRS